MSDHGSANPKLAILGTRGIPAGHGGFETFAEKFAPYLVDRGWKVRVYCQAAGEGDIQYSSWQGVELVTVPVRNSGPWGTIVFDWVTMRHAAAERFPMLVLGYNTAIFSAIGRLSGCQVVMNMDGIEWRRSKWSAPIKGWFFINEIFGCLLANKLVADHPEISKHLQRWVGESKITMLPYGADSPSTINSACLDQFGVEPKQFVLIIARPEPENSILEMVKAFSLRTRGLKLVVLGNYGAQNNSFQRDVLAAASDEVLFPGAVYDSDIVATLRSEAVLYLHGHQVGGTNPSLVEALASGSPVLAHDNKFNRWVAGDRAAYFKNDVHLERQLSRLLNDPDRLQEMSSASRDQFLKFNWEEILRGYEQVCRVGE
ncbi:MAG TPA: glycosyl transferase [Gammaproteobacteria bacterium]|nr:glycosyl transferase [Gammaproteobacteria bacterium]